MSSKDKPVNAPRCPKCNIIGIDEINYQGGINYNQEDIDTSDQSPFYVIYCKNCGHIYQILERIAH